MIIVNTIYNLYTFFYLFEIHIYHHKIYMGFIWFKKHSWEKKNLSPLSKKNIILHHLYLLPSQSKPSIYMVRRVTPSLNTSSKCQQRRCGCCLPVVLCVLGGFCSFQPLTIRMSLFILWLVVIVMFRYQFGSSFPCWSRSRGFLLVHHGGVCCLGGFECSCLSFRFSFSFFLWCCLSLPEFNIYVFLIWVM